MGDLFLFVGGGGVKGESYTNRRTNKISIQTRFWDRLSDIGVLLERLPELSINRGWIVTVTRKQRHNSLPRKYGIDSQRLVEGNRPINADYSVGKPG